MVTDDPEEMASCFLQSFASVFTSVLAYAPAAHQECENDIDPFIVTVDQVERTLSLLDPNSSMGDDGIHPSC